MIFINATGKYIIKAYYTEAYRDFIDASVINGYINYISRYGCHDIFPASYHLDDFSLFDEITLYLEIFNDIDLSNQTTTNHSMSVRTILSANVSNLEHSIARNDIRSYILSLPDRLNNNLTVSPGQELTYDIA